MPCGDAAVGGEPSLGDYEWGAVAKAITLRKQRKGLCIRRCNAMVASFRRKRGVLAWRGLHRAAYVQLDAGGRVGQQLFKRLKMEKDIISKTHSTILARYTAH